MTGVRLLIHSIDAVIKIKDRTSQLRCVMKTIARNLLPGQYGFKPGHSDEVIAYNRDLVNRLKSGTNRAFSHIDPGNPVTACRNPIFADILAKTCGWFANPKGDGIRYGHYFTPGRSMQVVMAQLLTTVECAIDEWQTGIHKDLDFRESVYASVFNKHLEWLVEWEKFSRAHSQADVCMQRDLIQELR
ncbi:uncharacterized protein B0H18DRAFT_875627 [Fomitopsis serialis]|uniref:uncharacterized protein n=1 Tax=Fomitopsis serialis TaxID=139415 RepID=UPI0020081FEA|nr:uncharacterized protein B0H18DRAFT_875627 [Neoantrodia serialis]KAH9927363.1 hypothetical protein B0H18DRAFT_875627 [Neoantrodia serialis]